MDNVLSICEKLRASPDAVRGRGNEADQRAWIGLEGLSNRSSTIFVVMKEFGITWFRRWMQAGPVQDWAPDEKGESVRRDVSSVEIRRKVFAEVSKKSRLGGYRRQTEIGK